MEFIHNLLEMLASAARAVWPGVLGAAAAGYLGWSLAGSTGFLISAALGALAGTWAGARLGLVPVPSMTRSPATDQLLYAAGAFIMVGIGYVLLQFALIVFAAVVLLGIAAAWLMG